MKRRFSLLLVSMAFVLTLTAETAWATSASISVSGNEGAIPLAATANFTSYRHCDSQTPPNCWNVDSGRLSVYDNGSFIGNVDGNGSATLSTILDGGAMSQGQHTLTATARDSEWVSESSETVITIDNTPHVSVNSSGQVEGAFDPTGTVTFKEHLAGDEGRLFVSGPEGLRSKYFEGTSITWKYSDLYGHQLDAGVLQQGTHTIRAWATAANGAGSGEVVGTFIVDNTPHVTVESTGQVEGLFDPTGTVIFKESTSGNDGRLFVSGPEGLRSKYLEGTSLIWKYSDLYGHQLDAGVLRQGTNTITAWAIAANGASTENVSGTFIVDNMPHLEVDNLGQVEGLFDPTGTVIFKECASGNEGRLYVSGPGGFNSKWLEGTNISWKYSDIRGHQLDAGVLPQGTNTITAWATAANGVGTENVSGTFIVDNTPHITAQDLGQVEGLFDPTGTVIFKECASGNEGRLYVSGPEGFKSKWFEGTNISWKYSDIYGHQLDAGGYSEGVHTITAWAYAANGAGSQTVQGRFTVSRLNKPKNLGACKGTCQTCTLAGNPINFSTGNKYQHEKDLDLGEPGLPLRFSRFYNSQSSVNSTLGYGWTATFSEYLTFTTGKSILHQADGAEVHFISDGQGKFVSETDKVSLIEPVVGGGYSLKEPDGRVLSFDGTGKLIRITDRNGNTQTLAYSSGKLASVEDNFGKRLEFAYGSNGKLATLATPIGPFSYLYDGNGNLSIVTKPDQKTRTYLYEDPNDVHNLTGILNENGIRSLTVQYDSQDRAILSQGAGGTKSVSIVYDNNFVRHVTDSLGRTTTFKLYVEKGIARVKEVSGEGCGSCLGSIGEHYEFNDRLYVTQKTDVLGVVTAYTYDERGNVLTKKEAVGTPEDRTTTFTYHPTYDLVASITKSSVANPGQNTTTTFTYDERGNLLSRTESGFNSTGAIARTTTYTYDGYGQVTRVDGPRTDLNDFTILEYYPNTPDQGLNRGRLKKITDPMGFETTLGQYNAFGKPGTGTDPNNIVTTYTYDSMGRLKTRTVDGLTTTFSYDEVGSLILSHYPDGREFTYDYTDKGWLEKILALPGSINYIYDTEGNRTREEIKDGEGTALRYTQFEYDNKNRPHKTIFPDSNYEERSYDLKGNLQELRDQKDQRTSYAYDPMSRLISVTQPGSVITGYAYDKLDNLISVTDAENHATTYTYDDLGRLVSTLSPDTNLTTYTYDAAGNLLTKTDANGITASYTYDVLNRLTRVSFPDSTQDVTFTFDQGVNGKGRLTAMTDPSGTYTYAYDSFGNLVTETRITEGITFTTQYSYSQGGPLQSITYPSGRIVTYERDAAGRVIRVKDTVGGTNRTLADNISHLPFGPLRSLTYGNGMVETRAFDQMYRLTGLSAGSVMNLSYTHDQVGNILSINNLADPARSQSFTYDDLQRLIRAQGIYGTEGYTYDKVGNRLQKMQNGQAEDYSYVSGTNKIQAITGLNPLAFTYDPNGNTTAMGDQGFTYNLDNRLIRASRGGAPVGEYVYNGKGERTKKTAEGKTILFLWDKDGNMIGEADETRAIVREYVYLDGKLLSLISSEPPKDIEVRVSTSKGRNLSNINVYAFTEAGAYTGKTARTDSQGMAVFQNGLLADGNYKFRADYLSYQFWSPVIGVPGGNTAEVVIEEETAELTVSVAGEAKPGVKVYLFNGAGSYLGLYQTSDAQGKVFFDLPVGKAFKFRADYLGSQYWSAVVTIQAGVQNTIPISTGGGSLTVTLKKDADTSIPGAKLYLFSQSGSYLGQFGTGDENGVVQYTVSGGSYKVRADYLGYQFWSDLIGVSSNSLLVFTIPHEDVEITVEGVNAGEEEPKADVPAYLFTSAGMYVNVSRVTDHDGHVVFSLPHKEYKVRADYLQTQFWSPVFNWEDKTVAINEGMADVTVTSMGQPLQGVNVYAFTATGSYLNLNRVTDGQGKVSFRLPEGSYKFRSDYMGSQYWSGDTTLIPHVVNPIPISTGGGVFTLKVEKSAGEPLVGASCYLFSSAGAYLSQQVVTNGLGETGFNLADGSYKIRIDCLGYQYWTEIFSVPGSTSLTHSIPHQNVTITVSGDYNGDVQAKSDINVYLFTSSGTYVNVSRLTDHEGHAIFNVPPGDYKVREDYLGAQYWSEVFNQTNKNIVINEGMADVLVNQNGAAIDNVSVHVFSAAGSYLNLQGTTGPGGIANFRLPEGTYRFRGDYQGSQFWVTETVIGHQVKPVNLDTGGGLFTLRVEKAPGVALADKPVYVFTPSGSYLNMTAETNAQGEVSFALASGWYRFRVDHMGYQFWGDALEVLSTLSHTMSIPHRETTISVNTFYTGAMVPLENASVYLFTEAGSYLNLNAPTSAAGQVKFNVPDQKYKVRVDYLGDQYWSEVFQWQDKEVTIDEGLVDLNVTWNGAEVSNVPVYLFTETGSYLNRSANTNAQGHATFTVPVKGYKFRIDYNGHQYWTQFITPIAHQPLAVEVPLEQLALMPTNDPLCRRLDGSTSPEIAAVAMENKNGGISSPSRFTPHASRALPEQGIKVASLGSLIGLITQTTVAQVAQPKVYYYLTDHLGTPQKVMDAAGVVVWSGDYKPFGEAESSVSTVQNHFRFPGQYYDKETALHYNYHRHFQPKLGRYVTPDPIGVPAGPNLFEYAESDPVSKYDPFGLWPTWIHNKMIRAAFSSLPPDLQREIERGSRYADEFQDSRFSYMHAMRQKGQNVELARKLMDAYISDRMKAYECEVAKGNLNEAYFVLGMALHPIMDSTSPTHEGFQWWDNFFAMPGYYPAYHWMTEQWHLTAEISQTVDLMMGTLQRYGIKTISTH